MGDGEQCLNQLYPGLPPHGAERSSLCESVRAAPRSREHDRSAMCTLAIVDDGLSAIENLGSERERINWGGHLPSMRQIA